MEYDGIFALFCLSKRLNVVEEPTVHPLDGWKGAEMRTTPSHRYSIHSTHRNRGLTGATHVHHEHRATKKKYHQY